MEIKLGDLIVNFDSKRRPLSKMVREKMKGTYPYYGAASIFDYVNDYIFDGEYILLGEDGTVLNTDGTPILQLTKGKFWANNHTHVLRNNERLIDFKYLYYLLKNTVFSEIVTGAVQQKISQGQMNALVVNYNPDKKVQEKIASILSKIDEKIELNSKMIGNLEEQVFALYKNAFIESEKNREICMAGEYFNITIGKTPPRIEQEWFSTDSVDVRWVSISDMGKCGLYINNTSEYLTREAIRKYNVVVVPDNTVLLSFKLTVGRLAITDGEMSTNEAIAHFVTNTKGINPYLYCYLKTFKYEELGSTSSIATAINSKIVKAMPFVIPFDEELNTFNEIALPTFALIKEKEKESKKLSELRDSLLPKLMSGEIDVEDLDI
jgi:type I restriction enzyme, S subunit